MKLGFAKRVYAIILALGLTLTSVCGAGAAKYEWNAALNVVEDTMPYIVMSEFKRLVEERSKGDVSIIIYTAGQLGGDREMSEGIMTGNIELSATNPSTMVSLVPAAAIFDLHNIFSDLEHCRRTIDGPFFAKAVDIFKQKNIHVLGFSDIGFRKLMSNREIKNLADLNGLKVRVMENKHQITYWKSFDANPTPMDWGEVYIGLQQGTIDANEQPFDFIVSNKLYEVQKYLIESDHLMQYVILNMSQKLYASLPENIKKLVDECGKEACAYGRKQTDLRSEQKKKILMDYGMKFSKISSEDKKKMYDLSGASRDSVRQAVGDELFSFYMDCVEKAK